MTIEELLLVANAVEVNDDNAEALRKSLEDAEKEFELAEHAKIVNNEHLSRSYSF